MAYHGQQHQEHHERINLGRRLVRLESALRRHSLSTSTTRANNAHDLLAMDLDHLAATLQRLFAPGTSDPLLLSYADRLQSLQSLVAHAHQDKLDTRPRPLYNLKAARLCGPVTARSSTGSTTSKTKDLFEQLANEVRVQREAQDAKRRELLNSALSAASSTSSSSSLPAASAATPANGIRHRSGLKSSSIAKPSSSTSTEHQDDDDDDNSLDDHARLQDTLTANLVSMASVLKANSLAFSEGLKTDAAVLDQADQLLAANATRMAAENTRLKKHRAAARWTTWTLVLVLVVVAAASVGMFIVIKLFRK